MVEVLGVPPLARCSAASAGAAASELRRASFRWSDCSDVTSLCLACCSPWESSSTSCGGRASGWSACFGRFERQDWMARVLLGTYESRVAATAPLLLYKAQMLLALPVQVRLGDSRQRRIARSRSRRHAGPIGAFDRCKGTAEFVRVWAGGEITLLALGVIRAPQPPADAQQLREYLRFGHPYPLDACPARWRALWPINRLANITCALFFAAMREAA